MDLSVIWEWAKTLGPGGTALCLYLYLEEKGERKQLQQTVLKLHKENVKRLERILKTIKDRHALNVSGPNIAKSKRKSTTGGK